MTAQQLRRLEPARGHPLLLVLLQALVIERGDELLGQFDKLWRLARGRAERRVLNSAGGPPASATSSPRWAGGCPGNLLECAATGEVPLSRVEREMQNAALTAPSPRA